MHKQAAHILHDTNGSENLKMNSRTHLLWISNCNVSQIGRTILCMHLWTLCDLLICTRDVPELFTAPWWKASTWITLSGLSATVTALNISTKVAAATTTWICRMHFICNRAYRCVCHINKILEKWLRDDWEICRLRSQRVSATRQWISLFCISPIEEHFGSRFNCCVCHILKIYFILASACKV